MATLDQFQAVRPRLLSLAYLMLGSSSEAEDVVQEAWLRWQALDLRAVRKPTSWLFSSVRRLCLERRASRHTREPEPRSPGAVVAEQPLELESISMAFMLVLERLGPTERAVYILHQVLGYGQRDVADALHMSEPLVRQSVQRAIEHLAANRSRFAGTAEAHQSPTETLAGHSSAR
jgi:RNA polymerase sigma-70 factor, ECF subfamily